MTLEKDIIEFKEQLPNHTKEGRKLFLKHELIENFTKKISERPFSKTVFLGKQEKEIKPSNYLITTIKVNKKNSIKIDEEKEWLFLCGRDIFIKTEDKNIIGKKVIIQNEYGENIGLGLIQKNQIKNLTDIGTYIRE